MFDHHKSPKSDTSHFVFSLANEAEKNDRTEPEKSLSEGKKENVVELNRTSLQIPIILSFKHEKKSGASTFSKQHMLLQFTGEIHVFCYPQKNHYYSHETRVVVL